MSSVGSLSADEPAGPGALQQRVALLEHPLVVGHHARESRGALHEQLVEHAPTHRRLAAHDGQVFGCEQHAVRVARQLAGLHGRAVELGAIRALPVELQLDEQLAVAVGEQRPHDRGIRPGPDQRLVARDAVRTECGEVADRLDEVGLALPVAPDEHRGARPEHELGALVVAVVGEGEAGDVHAGLPSRPSDRINATRDRRPEPPDVRAARASTRRHRRPAPTDSAQQEVGLQQVAVACRRRPARARTGW